MRMHMNWTRLLAVCIVCVATVAFAGMLAAQDQPGSQQTTKVHRTKHRSAPSVDARLEHLSKQLNLTDDEKEKIRPLLQDEMTKVQAVRSNSSLSESQQHRRIAMIRKKTRTSIGEILTPDQKQHWEQMQAERRSHNGGHHGNPTGSGSGSGGPGSAPPPNN